MKNLLLILTALVISISTLEASNNLTLLGQLSYTQELSDIWGYEHPNTGEYALVGTVDGVSIVSLSNPANPVEVAFVPGPNSVWYDIKTYGNYAYVINEANGGGGLTIIDLSGLPSNVTSSLWTGASSNWMYNGSQYLFDNAHNIFIDEFGIGYICGGNSPGGGALFIDIASNPTDPQIMGTYDDNYIHDMYVRSNKMYAGEIYQGRMTIIDVSDKTVVDIATNPSVLLGAVATPDAFTHNCWISDDENFAFTTDETSGAWIPAYDISDPTNIVEVDRYQSNPGSGVIPHNVHVLNDFLITSYYRDGITVVDATNPSILVQVGHYDTDPGLSGNGFDGSWGAYPFLPSGKILASDIANGLYVLDNNYPAAAFLTGLVTDAASGASIPNVNVTITGLNDANTTSAADGSYGTGTASSGSYQVTYSATGYSSVTVTVTFVNGQTVVENVQLNSQGSIALSGQVLNNLTNAPIANADIEFFDGSATFTASSSSSGAFTLTLPTNITYDIIAGSWGYLTESISAQLINSASQGLTIYLDPGYCDDFTFDFGWTVNSTASTGLWELGEPVGTDFNGTESNPELDVSSDFGTDCFVTGNGGGGAGNDDVDNGLTTLTSPVFDLTGYSSPEISFYRWFFNDGGATAPDDEMVISLSNGSQTQIINTIVDGDPNESSWFYESYNVSSLISPTNNMTLIVEISDVGGGHLVEGGLDQFKVTDSGVAAPVADFSASDQVGCGQFSTNFFDSSSNNPTSWLWSFPGGSPSTSTAQNPTVTYSSPGNYSVTLISSNSGGSNTQTYSNFISVNNLPSVSISNLPSSTSNATPIFLSGSPAGGTFSGAGMVGNTFNPAIAGNGLTNVQYSYTDANGCSNTIVNSIFVFSVNYNFAQYNLATISPRHEDGLVSELEETMEIYPNPSTDLITIDFISSIDVNLGYEVLDLNGRIIQQGLFSASSEIDISELSNGYYLFKVNVNDKSIVKSLIGH